MKRRRRQLPLRNCDWCGVPLPNNGRLYQRFCCDNHRKRASDTRARRTHEIRSNRPMKLRYDDPPFVGLAWKYYKMPEVDYPALIREALAEKWDGYALSCSEKSLRFLLSLFPEDLRVRVCAWVKPHNPGKRTHGIHNCVEYVLVVGGRQRRPGRRDYLVALPARRGGTLPGRKPIKFAVWLYELLGGAPGDTLFEKFPGTGIVSRVWRELQSSGVKPSRRRKTPSAAAAAGEAA